MTICIEPRDCTRLTQKGENLKIRIKSGKKNLEVKRRIL